MLSNAELSIWLIVIRAPGDNSRTKDRPEYWKWLAKTAEKGKFTTIFIADGYASLTTYGGKPDAAYKGGANVGAMDPLVIVPLMAAVTESISFGVTASTSYIGKLFWYLKRRMDAECDA